MHLAISPHTRLAYYESDLIVLDIANNRFHFIKDVPYELVTALYGSGPGRAQSSLYVALRGLGAIVPAAGPRSDPPPMLKPQDYLEQRWMLPLAVRTSISARNTADALGALWRAALRVKYGGFRSIVSIGPAQTTDRIRAADVDAKIDAAIAGLNRVFALDFSGNNCLTYSLALVLLLRRRLPAIKLVIGVKTRPFLSHAWVEYEGRVINDDPDLRCKLAAILEI